MPYPASSYPEGVDLTIIAGNQLHQVINGEANEVVSTTSGDIPSVRKALADSMMFKVPVDWVQGEVTTDPLETRLYNGQPYWAPEATLANPITLGVSPVATTDWLLAPQGYRNDYNLGKYQAGILISDSLEYVVYNGKSYFANNPPYTTTATLPDADVNLFAGGYLTSQQLPLYTAMVYKASGGNSAVDNMVSGIPVAISVGEKASTGLGSWTRVSESGGLSDFMAMDNKVGLKDFISTSVDSAINEAFNFIKKYGGEILLDEIHEYSTPLSFDTSADKWEVAFIGTGTRTSGLKYIGSDSAGDWALTIGTNGVGQSGYISFINCGVYGNGQEINGVQVFKAQRYQRLSEFTVRNFNGMMLECGDGDVFLNDWGMIFLLNGCRGCDLGSEFNANSISNIVIENMTYTSSEYADDVPVAKFDGIGTNIDMLSIEACPSDVMLDVSNTITINTLYQEANHATNIGVNARCVVTHGSNPKILSGDIKLPGVNANTSGFYVIDLDDSDKAQLEFVVRTPGPNPNSYQKPILWGTSKRAELNIKWDMFDGIGYPSRTENAAFAGENRENSIVNGVKRIFGQDPELIGRQLMTSYCINIDEGRVLYPNSNNRVGGYIESNISSSSRFERSFGFSQRKDVMKISRDLPSGDFGIYKDYTLVADKKYMFSTIVGRKSVDNARPRMRVTDQSGTQDYFIEPRDPFFTGWTQISVVTTLNDASSVRFWPITAANNTGDNYLAMAFIIDLEQFEMDHGVSFDGMTTKEIEDLINPSYISEEFGRQYRGTLPDSGKWNRGERVYKYPPVAGQTEGWVCSVTGDFAGTPPTLLTMANLT